jgi:hypothetical protein
MNMTLDITPRSQGHSKKSVIVLQTEEGEEKIHRSRPPSVGLATAETAREQVHEPGDCSLNFGPCKDSRNVSKKL